MKDKALNFLKNLWNWIKNTPELVKTTASRTVDFIGSWWRGIIIASLLIIFLYYPLGAIITNNIDRNVNYNFAAMDDPKQSKTIEQMAYIINREVNEKLWTPNLPFFFPSYFLDNMPNFQLGMFDALKDVSQSFGKNFGNNEKMKEISENLAYPGTIWMFSPENKLKPVSSANSKYRAARKELNKFNQDLLDGKETFYRRPNDLVYILARTRVNINKTIKDLEEYIIEESDAWYNSKSDDKFFYNQGKLYGYYLLLNAIGQDYKDLIVNSNQYENWTKIIKALENASQIDPTFVRNARLNSSFAPNHLAYLSFYALKAESNIQNIIRRTRVTQ
ncbi:MAG: DUF2333 family protein [Alphaproteobacteria bacterium]